MNYTNPFLYSRWLPSWRAHLLAYSRYYRIHFVRLGVKTIHRYSKCRTFQSDTVALIIHYIRHGVIIVMRSTKWYAFMIYVTSVWIGDSRFSFWCILEWLVIKARYKHASEWNVRHAETIVSRFASRSRGIKSWTLWHIAWHWNNRIKRTRRQLSRPVGSFATIRWRTLRDIVLAWKLCHIRFFFRTD